MSALEITQEIRNTASEVASRWGLPGELHEGDHLLRFIVQKRGAKVGTENYFTSGRSAAAKISSTLDALNVKKERLKVLDFAAGYGRVARHAKSMLAKHQLYAADIHPEACTFVQEQLDIPAFCSSLEPSGIEVGYDYDFIYVLSLFSHLPDKTFGNWIGALSDILAPGGYLLFTANGEDKLSRRTEFFGAVFDPEQGFGYRELSDQLDLDGEQYGSMVVSTTYVLDKLKRHAPTVRLHSFRAGVWLNGQDEWIIQRVR